MTVDNPCGRQESRDRCLREAAGIGAEDPKWTAKCGYLFMGRQKGAGHRCLLNTNVPEIAGKGSPIILFSAFLQWQFFVLVSGVGVKSNGSLPHAYRSCGRK